jgi:monovalent cation:H+ antiporter-2, CPA2 family
MSNWIGCILNVSRHNNKRHDGLLWNKTGRVTFVVILIMSIALLSIQQGQILMVNGLSIVDNNNRLYKTYSTVKHMRPIRSNLFYHPSSSMSTSTSTVTTIKKQSWISSCRFIGKRKQQQHPNTRLYDKSTNGDVTVEEIDNDDQSNNTPQRLLGSHKLWKLIIKLTGQLQHPRSLRRRTITSIQQLKQVLINQKKNTQMIFITIALAITVISGTIVQLSKNNPSISSSTSTASSTTTIAPIERVQQKQKQSRQKQKSSPVIEKTVVATTTKATKPKQNNKDGEIKVEEEIEHALVVVEGGLENASRETGRTIYEAAIDLQKYLVGPKSDTLLLLLATALVTPLSKKLSISPILGFLASGMLLGPNGFGLISGIHTTETLAELGIVFFLFEMGIELSFQRLLSMKRDVFGLGLLQFLLTAGTVAVVASTAGQLPANACVVLGGGIALSSSAFVLQLLKDKNQLATRFGKASFGVLLFQDLAVVPLLVVTPILAGGEGASLATALGGALIKAMLALGSIALTGRFVLNPLFKIVAAAQSQEAFLGVVLLTVLSMSFLTEGLGLSNTLGAFLAGVLLSETRYRYQVEADIAPFRGVLLGLFFVTVGFEIDLKLIASNLPLVSSLVIGILGVKALVTTLLSLGFGLSLSTSQQTGLMLSQGGEFAFVAFGLARSLGILDAPTTKLMLTSVSLTMATTPFMASLGSKIAKQLEEKADFSHYLGQDRDANEIKESTDFTVVVGYGAVGKVVCDVLDLKFIKYVGLDVDPNKAIQARNKGLPVFYGDIGRQEVAEAFNVGKASAVIVCIADRAQANRALIALRRWYPNLKIFARAVDADHASRLQNTLNVAAMVPILPEDNLLLTLPFVGAVMKALGVPTEEVNAMLESKRKEVLSGRGLSRNEEEIALLQLGIDVTPPSKKLSLNAAAAAAAAASKGSSSSSTTSDEMSSTSTTTTTSSSSSSSAAVDVLDAERIEKAAERRKAAETKSPFVAQVIEEICPESANDDDMPCVTPTTTTKSIVDENGGENSSTTVDASQSFIDVEIIKEEQQQQQSASQQVTAVGE